MLIRSVILGVALGAFTFSPLGSAGEKGGRGKGKAKKEAKKEAKEHKKHKHDSGEDEGAGEGKKKGWGGKDVPPGIAKQGEEKIAAWKEHKKKAKESLHKRYREHKGEDLDDAEKERLDEAMDEMAGAGGDVERGRELLEKGLKKGMTPEEMKELGRILRKKVEDGASVESAEERAKDILEKQEKVNLKKVLREWAAEKVAEAAKTE